MGQGDAAEATRGSLLQAARQARTNQGMRFPAGLAVRSPVVKDLTHRSEPWGLLPESPIPGGDGRG